MGKVYREVTGKISGKVGDVVFVQGKNGQTYIRMRPENVKVSQSAKSVNVRFIMAVMAHMYVLLKPYIGNLWEKLVKNKPQTGEDYFIHHNHNAVYESIPDKNKLCSPDNFPSFAAEKYQRGKLQNPGVLLYLGGEEIEYPEGPMGFVCAYDKENRHFKMKWETRVFTEGHGTPEDTAHIFFLYYKPGAGKLIEDKSWNQMELLSYERKRGDGSFEFELPKGMKAEYGTAFLFFSDGKKYSQSVNAVSSENG